jgi:hypothetical protein
MSAANIPSGKIKSIAAFAQINPNKTSQKHPKITHELNFNGTLWNFIM